LWKAGWLKLNRRAALIKGEKKAVLQRPVASFGISASLWRTRMRTYYFLTCGLAVLWAGCGTKKAAVSPRKLVFIPGWHWQGDAAGRILGVSVDWVFEEGQRIR
jgi:hypothetical protein